MMTLIATVLFCLGLRIISDEGQVLYFLRKPFENNAERLELVKELAPGNPLLRKEMRRRGIINFIGTPFILCITCMASIWGVTVFIFMNGLHISLIPAMIFNSVAASFIQTLIWKLYAKLD